MRRVVVPLGSVMVLVGCGAVPDPNPSPVVSAVVTPVRSPSPTPSPTPSPSPSPAPSPSPSPTSFPSYPADLPTQDPETAAIIAGWQEYWRVYEKFAADPLGFTDFTEINYVTAGEASRLTMDRIALLRQEKLRSEGGMVFRDVVVSTNVPHGEGSALVAYCADLSRLRVIHLETGEVIRRSGTIIENIEMTKGQDGIWRVAQLENEAASC